MKTNNFISRYCLVMFLASPLTAQDKADPPAAGPVKWVNVVPPTIKADPALVHGTFFSQANKTDIGYFVALPRGYDAPDAKTRRFPVIYYLHGGNGNEGRGVQGYPQLRPMLTSEDYPGHGIDWKIQNTDRRVFDFIAESLKHFPKN